MPGSEGGCAEKARVHDPRTRDLAAQPTLPGYDLITAILLAKGHVIARVREGIALPFQDAPDRGWLPGGSRMSWLNAPSGKKEDRLPVRVGEHSALVPGPDGDGEVSETCTLITTLLDDRAVPAGEIMQAYLTRWSASETAFGENKATITGAGNRTSGPVLRSGCPQLVLQEAWAWLTGTQLVRASEAAALRGGEAAALAPRAEGTPEIRAHVRDQDDPHRETRGHRVRTRPLLNPSTVPATGRRQIAPPRGPWNRAPEPPRHARRAAAARAAAAAGS